MRDLDQTIEGYRQQLAVDVYGLATSLNLLVTECELEPDISGMIEPLDDTFHITVNSSHHVFRKRFTVAHELGHWLYHSHLIGQGLGDNRLYYSSNTQRFYNNSIRRQHENQANAFAAWLLMPSSELENDLRRFSGTPDWDYLSQRYQISKSALRMKSRGLVRRI